MCGHRAPGLLGGPARPGINQDQHGLRPKARLGWTCLPVLMWGLIVLGLTACDNSIDAFGPDRQTPVFWMLLDASDTVHYARLQRSFQSPGQDAFIAALDPANLYYPAGTVQLRVEALGPDSSIQQRWFLERVDGASAGFPKEPGVFADSAHVLYRFTAALNPDLMYRVVLHTPAAEDTLRAIFPLVDSFRIFYPQSTTIDIDYSDTGTFRFDWQSAPNGFLYEAYWEVQFEELVPGSSDWEAGSVRVPLFRNRVHLADQGLVLLQQNVFTTSFYTGLRGRLEPAEGGQRRLLQVDIICTAGGKELYLLYLNNLATLDLGELFITGTYTNLPGAVGLASSRSSVRFASLSLTDATLDSLACGRLTSLLGFQRADGSPCP